MASASLSVQILVLLAAYLIGSVSFGVVVSKLMGLADPHTYGSGNPGATNVLRTGNKKAALFTLLGDVGKGVLAVLLARWLAPSLGLSDMIIMLVGLAAFIGHLYPVFHGFKGGKGVATALGVLLALSWPVALICAAVWLIMAFGLKISSLAALAATVISPLAAMFLVQQPSWQAAIAVIAALVLLRHRSNIQNLLSGKESKIGSGK